MRLIDKIRVNAARLAAGLSLVFLLDCSSLLPNKVIEDLDEISHSAVPTDTIPIQAGGEYTRTVGSTGSLYKRGKNIGYYNIREISRRRGISVYHINIKLSNLIQDYNAIIDLVNQKVESITWQWS